MSMILVPNASWTHMVVELVPVARLQSKVLVLSCSRALRGRLAVFCFCEPSVRAAFETAARQIEDPGFAGRLQARGRC